MWGSVGALPVLLCLLGRCLLGRCPLGRCPLGRCPLGRCSLGLCLLRLRGVGGGDGGRPVNGARSHQPNVNESLRQLTQLNLLFILLGIKYSLYLHHL